MRVQGRHIYIAPGGKHLLVKKLLGGVQTVINEQSPENGYRPSVDVLFRSAVPALNGRVLAIILTGLGDARECRAIRQCGYDTTPYRHPSGGG